MGSDEEATEFDCDSDAEALLSADWCEEEGGWIDWSPSINRAWLYRATGSSLRGWKGLMGGFSRKVDVKD